MGILAIPTVAILISWNALPGDHLYPLKRNLEKIALVIVGSHFKTEVALRSKLIERRFDESTTLLTRSSALGPSELTAEVESTKEKIIQQAQQTQSPTTTSQPYYQTPTPAKTTPSPTTKSEDQYASPSPSQSPQDVTNQVSQTQQRIQQTIEELEQITEQKEEDQEEDEDKEKGVKKKGKKKKESILEINLVIKSISPPDKFGNMRNYLRYSSPKTLISKLTILSSTKGAKLISNSLLLLGNKRSWVNF